MEKLAHNRHTNYAALFLKIVGSALNLTFGSLWNMHKQILFSRRRVAVGRLQALVLCVEVGHPAVSPQISCHTLSLLLLLD